MDSTSAAAGGRRRHYPGVGTGRQLSLQDHLGSLISHTLQVRSTLMRLAHQVSRRLHSLPFFHFPVEISRSTNSTVSQARASGQPRCPSASLGFGCSSNWRNRLQSDFPSSAGALEGAGEQVISTRSHGAAVVASARALSLLPKQAPWNLDRLGLGPRHRGCLGVVPITVPGTMPGQSSLLRAGNIEHSES